MYSIQNAKAMNEEYPDTFCIPNRKSLKQVKKGTLVKLIFTDGIHGERMWVEVTRKLKGNRFEGILINEPVFIDSIGYEDNLIFSEDHIIQIM